MVTMHEMLPSRLLGRPDLARFLDGILCCDGKLRLFFGGGAAAAIQPTGFDELRDISGALMLVGRGTAGPFRLSLADGSGVVLSVTPHHCEYFQGLRCMLVMRLAETAAQVAEGLAWHRARHGAEAALVVNRAPGDAGADFASALRAACPDLTLLVVDLALPAGAPETGPEAHPFLAPDAPGKDRMLPPDADPWRAPLDEPALYELLKWRYLAQARAVVVLEACDILAAPLPNGATVFELAEAQGVIALLGRRSYPWRVRAGQSPSFGDHICRMFDNSSGIARWAAAPAQLDLQKTWRQSRISHTTPRQALPFYRAMALRVSDSNGAPLAPKTALIEAPELLAMAQDLGAKPVRPPASVAKPMPAAASTGQRVAIVTTMKNEAPFILEWLAYHRAIGVTDFLVYTNDCTDGTDTMLQVLQERGLCQWRENGFRQMDLKPQHAALQQAETEAVMQDCDWGICMDVDEFINIKIGDGTLPALFAAMEAALPGANMVAMTWRLFGNAAVHDYRDEPMLQQFSRCAPEFSRKPHQAWGFKTLFRNIETYKKLGVHRPKGLKPDLWDQVRWLNGSGKPLPKEMFRNGWRSTATSYGYDWVQLNHYAVRSAESFLVKRDRGRANHTDRDQGMNYWFRMNHNAETETSIQRMVPVMQAELDRLLADPQIRAAHQHGVACHRAKIRELRATETQAAFYAALTSPRMDRLCQLQRHFGAGVFNAGPDVIPKDLPLRDLPEDFFFTVTSDDGQQH